MKINFYIIKMGLICCKEGKKQMSENVTTENNSIINEVFIKDKKINSKIDNDTINKVRIAVCKIIMDKMIGTGFFMIFQNRKFLVTCYHVINPEIKNFEMEIWNKKIKKLELKNHQIKYFIEFDVTVIELNNSENFINDIKFLDYDLNFIKGYNQYKNIEVFSLGYPYGGNLTSDSGIITEIKGWELYHNINTEVGYSGSPIILFTTLKVIGIHKGGETKKNINFGIFIGEILKEINNPQIMIKKKLVENNKRIYFEIIEGNKCIINYKLYEKFIRELGFFIKIPIKKNKYLTGVLTKYHFDETTLNNIKTININKNKETLGTINSNDIFILSDEFLNITFIEINNLKLDFSLIYEGKKLSNNITLINYSEAQNSINQTSGNFIQKWGITIKYKLNENQNSSYSNLGLLIDNQLIGIHKKNYSDYSIAINIDAISKALKLNYSENMNNQQNTPQKRKESKFSTEMNIYNLIKKGLDLTDVPNLFVSPPSLFVTPIWFLRTRHAWYWTPTEPNKNDFYESNWMIIIPKNSLEVIGGYWDGIEPAQRNIDLIHWLEKSKLTYCG